MSASVPKGRSEIERDAKALRAILDGKLTLVECEKFVTAWETIVGVADDEVSDRVRTLLTRPGGKVTEDEGHQAYVFLSNGGVSSRPPMGHGIEDPETRTETPLHIPNPAPRAQRGEQTYTYTYTTSSSSWDRGAAHPPRAPQATKGARQSAVHGPNATRTPNPAKSATANPLVRLNAWLGTSEGKTYAGGTAAVLVVLIWLGHGISDRIKGPPSSHGAAPEATYQAPPAERYAQMPAPATPVPGQPPAPEPSFKEVAAPIAVDPSVPTTAVRTSDRWSPNGKPWPAAAGYLRSMPQRATGGLSKLTVDNTSGSSDVYVKLCSFAIEKCNGFRHVFIPQGSSFTMNRITPGTYDIRYRDLRSGRISKSESMPLRQIDEEQGTRYSVVRVTLYTVHDGNTTFEPVPEEQF